MSWKVLLKMLLTIIGPLGGFISPAIKVLLTDALTELYRKALATSNPWDDFLIGFLMDVLSIPRPEL